MADEQDLERTDETQGGLVSPVQMSENSQRTGNPTSIDATAGKVNTHEGGAKRDSYFRKRDYE